MKYYQKDKDAAISLLRETLIEIHDNPRNRDMIVRKSYDALQKSKPINVKMSSDIINVTTTQLNYRQAKEAIKLFESEYMGQGQSELWEWAINKAMKENK